MYLDIATDPKDDDVELIYIQSKNLYNYKFYELGDSCHSVRYV